MTAPLRERDIDRIAVQAKLEDATPPPPDEVDSWVVVEYVANLARQSMYITPAMVARVLAEVAQLHAVGPILDPTAYRRGVGNLTDVERVMRAFGTFRAELERLVERERNRGRR